MAACMQALAAASLDEVNEAWAGLGYYRRARFLLEGAQNIAARPDGQMPRTAQEWLKIPGGYPEFPCWRPRLPAMMRLQASN